MIVFVHLVAIICVKFLFDNRLSPTTTLTFSGGQTAGQDQELPLAIFYIFSIELAILIIVLFQFVPFNHAYLSSQSKLSHWLQCSIGNSSNVDYFLVDRHNNRYKV